MKNLIISTIALFILGSCTQQPSTDQIDYRDASQPIDKRVNALLSQMTLEEKVAQMTCIIDHRKYWDVISDSSDYGYGDSLVRHGMGHIANPFGDMRARQQAEWANRLQRYFVEETRLGIPVILHCEALHGLCKKGATSFPQAIGLGATWHPELIEEMFAMVAEEARTRGFVQVLSPTLDIGIEPRWGRTEETYGEDPYLAGRMAVAAVMGFQGDRTFTDKKNVIVTLKHFAGHCMPESGQHISPLNMGRRELLMRILPPYRMAVEEAHALSVMPAYNEIDGLPCHANRWLVTDLLRGEWGFTGHVVSDYSGVQWIYTMHKAAKDSAEAGLKALLAGVDVELPVEECYHRYMVGLVRDGKVPEALVDTACARVLRAKFQLGLFEDPYVDPELAINASTLPEHRDLAYQVALETITLLENKNSILPLAAGRYPTIAVIGPNAAAKDLVLGNYSGEPDTIVSLLEGIRLRVGDSARVIYAQGCSLPEERFPPPPDAETDRRLIAEARQLAAQADIIILAIGGNRNTSAEGGDRASLELLGMQNELCDALYTLGKPIITVLNNGRPLCVGHVAEQSEALLECWYLGQENGRAIAAVLFGDYNPGGKLPITIPRTTGQVHAWYNYKPAARRGYLFTDKEPLYCFGYGKSYTSFAYSNLRLENKSISKQESLKVYVDVENTGTRPGDEVAQLYIRDSLSSVTRPVKELKDFKRLHLKPGQKKTVRFILTPDKLALVNDKMLWAVEPGEFIIMAGGSSRDEDLIKTILIVE